MKAALIVFLIAVALLASGILFSTGVDDWGRLLKVDVPALISHKTTSFQD